jgi:hypothetical protein
LGLLNPDSMTTKTTTATVLVKYSNGNQFGYKWDMKVKKFKISFTFFITCWNPIEKSREFLLKKIAKIW